ncbi:Iron-sulfur cluster biosynthesis [Fragilaria crotonensis]|nr:Iron-sulfur cluster biosynthesis [Fragilaria crotonensis]
MARRFQPFSAQPIAATNADATASRFHPIVSDDDAPLIPLLLLNRPLSDSRNSWNTIPRAQLAFDWVPRNGCNGLSYTLNYVAEVSDKDEPLTTSNGVKVFIEPMALMNVIGTTMDWVETELSAEFTFTNPNSKGECGCGESFNV